MSIGSWLVCSPGGRRLPDLAGGRAWMFWLRTALATSMAVMPRDASFCGSSQMRML